MNGTMKFSFCALAGAACIAASGGAHATGTFNDLFLFGDSYTDTGAYVTLSNGLTAGAYLAQDLGINLVTSKSTNPGTSADAPLSAATFQQVATLYSLGARYFEIALLPTLIPLFADSAANINPLMQSIVPQLQSLYPDARFQLSNWGPDYDNVMRNAAAYGLTNTTDQCFNLSTGHTDPGCTNPNKYFYYYVGHPSNYVHEIVGNALATEAMTFFNTVAPVPEPSTYLLMGFGMVGLMLARRRSRAD